MADMVLLAWLLFVSSASLQSVPAGQIVGDVKCAADPSQSYALFVPSTYTPERAWPVIFAFDPGGRGRMPVERYQAAAEQYRFIVAGSNNSRNGSTENGRAVATMLSDVATRFQIDPKRIYLAGMSGGARLALGVASSSQLSIAGVIASSAGFPDGKFRKTVPFAIFATAGTEDFNHVEMRELDRTLTSPHRLAIFEGGHVWLSSELAIEAVEWLELQAVKSGLKPRDDAEIDRMLGKRLAAAKASTVDKDRFLAFQAIVADFEGLRDVSAVASIVAELGRDKNVRAALKKDRDEDDRELALLEDVRSAEMRLRSNSERDDALSELRRLWKDLSTKANKPEDSAERRFARRVLGGLSAGVTTKDPDYLKIIAEYRRGRGGR